MIKLTDILMEVSDKFSQEVIDLVNNNFKRHDGQEWRGDFFEKVKSNPNFVVIPSSQMGRTYTGDPNRCETNTFSYIKNKLSISTWEKYYDGKTSNSRYEPTPQDMVERSKKHYFPVAGYQVTEHGGLVEHWWVYDKGDNEHMETCPFHPTELFAYIGVINYDIQDEIMEADHVFDVDFFRSGNPYSMYFK